MSKRCENCGCILNGSICSNCHEELFILTYQAEDITEPVSKEFAEKAEEQKQEIKRKKEIGKP